MPIAEYALPWQGQCNSVPLEETTQPRCVQIAEKTTILPVTPVTMTGRPSTVAVVSYPAGKDDTGPMLAT